MSNAMRLFTALATTSIIISAMQAFADEEYQSFTTPSKNIWCVRRHNMTSDIPLSVECDVANHKWKNWIQGDKDGSHGTRFFIPGNGLAEAIGSSDSMVGGAAMVLGYGDKITFGDNPAKEGSITCISEKIGLTCTNSSGGLMHLNREFYVLNKPVPR